MSFSFKFRLLCPTINSTYSFHFYENIYDWPDFKESRRCSHGQFLLVQSTYSRKPLSNQKRVHESPNMNRYLKAAGSEEQLNLKS